MGQTGNLGCIREGAIADLLVVDGNPLEDISVLGSGGDRLPIIMKDGHFHKRTIKRSLLLERQSEAIALVKVTPDKPHLEQFLPLAPE